MAKKEYGEYEYARPAYPDINIDFSEMDSGFNDIIAEIEKSIEKSLMIPDHLLENNNSKQSSEPIKSRFEILDL